MSVSVLRKHLLTMEKNVSSAIYQNTGTMIPSSASFVKPTSTTILISKNASIVPKQLRSSQTTKLDVSNALKDSFLGKTKTPVWISLPFASPTTSSTLRMTSASARERVLLTTEPAV